MILGRALVREQAWRLLVTGGLVLAVAITLAVIAAAAAGLPPELLGSGRAWAAGVVALLPEVLAITLPLALFAAIVSLEEGGELAGARAAGVAPQDLALALWLPAVPFLLCLPGLVDTARPAALAAGKAAALTAARSTPEALWEGLSRQGGGTVVVDGGPIDGGTVRGLLPIAGGGLAFALSGLRATRSGIVAGPGEAVAVPAAIGADPQHGSFAGLHIGMPEIDRGLVDHTEAELSTRFLEGGALRWRRARSGAGDREAARRIATEVGRRRLLLPCVVLAMGLATVLLFWPVLALGRWVMVIGVPLLVFCAVGLPRLLAGIAGAAGGG